MFKKFAFLTSLLLSVPFAISIAELGNLSSEVAAIAASEEHGEYHGYTYTQKGINRYYDTHELTPSIKKTFWAPTGYKFTMEISDDQLNEILDQAESLRITYSYVDFTLSYNKFGMNIPIVDFSNDFANRQECFDYFKDKINTYESFYELEDVQIDTELSIDLIINFSAELTSYTFYFYGEEEIISPVDKSTFVNITTQYDDGALGSGQSIWINATPLDGFFYEYPTYNEYGFHTSTMEHREWLDPITWEELEGDFAVYSMKLYAYDTVEIADLSVGTVQVTYPKHPLTVKAKLEFDVKIVDPEDSSHVEYEHYTFWSDEYVIGDPSFHITIDGFDDRDSIQVSTDHDYAFEFDNLNDEELTSLQVKTTLKPVRLVGSDNVIEYFDMAVEPTSESEFYLYGDPTHMRENDPRYSFTKVDESHYVLKNVPLYVNDSFIVTNYETHEYYYNHSEYEGCHYHIEYGDSIYVDDEGVYNIHFDLNTSTDNYFSLEYLSPINIASQYQLSIKGKDPITLQSEDLSNLEQYAYGVSLNAGDEISVTYGENNSVINSSTWECCGFTLEDGKMIVTESGKYDIHFYPYSSTGSNIVLKTKPLPVAGTEGVIYYIPSTNEVILHHQGRDEEFLDTKFEGQYVIWEKSTSRFVSFDGLTLIDFNSATYEGDEDLISLAHNVMAVDYLGEWTIDFVMRGSTSSTDYGCEKKGQRLEVSTRDKSGDYIVLKSSFTNEELPEEVNLLLGGDKLEITPYVPSYQEGIKYYHSHVLEKDGVVEITEGENGKLTLTTLNPGVTNLTFTVECELFPAITKTIQVRVLDAIYDVAKIAVPNEFHYAGKDLTASVSIRGFTRIQNIDVSWDVTNKKGTKLDASKMSVKRDATVTLHKAESDDYTFVAYYEGVKLDSLTVQVRYTDLNAFLKINVWWIFLISLAFLVFVIFLKKLFSRGKTTVEHIEKAYQVFCQYVSDDKLTLFELKSIKKETTKCLHRCEDLNIEALNQYEKAIRYLRKSVSDCNSLIKKWDCVEIDEKATYVEKLDQDLNKALNVAREIETAKELVEQYHEKANRQNYEKLVVDKPDKKAK